MSFLLRSLGLSMLLGLLMLAATPIFVVPTSVGAEPSFSEPAVTTFVPLPPPQAQSGESLLARSPFVQNRSAFDRQLALMPPEPPVDVRVVGILKVGKEYRASILVGGQSTSVRKGDQTPVGVVTDIEPSAVVIEGATTRRIEMFRD